MIQRLHTGLGIPANLLIGKQANKTASKPKSQSEPYLRR